MDAIPEPPKPVVPAIQISKPIIGLIFFCITLILGSFFAGMKYQESKQSTNSSIDNAAEQLESLSPDPSEKLPENTQQESKTLQTYADNRIEGFTFKYDPSIWTISEVERGNEALSKRLDFGGIGLLLEESNTDGFLFISYSPVLGVGGGTGSIIESEQHFAEINNTYMRVFSDYDSKWWYGKSEYFIRIPQDQPLQEAISGFCPDVPQQGAWDDESCSKLQAGQIIGYTRFPSFRWLSRNATVNLDKFEVGWDEQSRRQQAAGVIVITVSYTGDTPELADQIVSQILR